MDNDLIIIRDYCTNSGIEPGFLSQLEEIGLIKIQMIDDEQYIDSAQLVNLERYVRWHYDLSVNIEGIDVIKNLLDRIEDMQNEINALHNRLHFYFSD